MMTKLECETFQWVKEFTLGNMVGVVPPTTVTLPELPRSDELPSLSPQRPDSTEHFHPQATVVEEAPTTRRYPARDRRPPDHLTYDS